MNHIRYRERNMKKGLIVGLFAMLSVLMFTMTALADWKEAGRDKWRIIYVDDEIQPVGQDTFVVREKKEYISEGPRCSCTPQEVIISYVVDSGKCKVRTHEMKALDEDGKVIFAGKGGELTPEFSLAPYCTIAMVNTVQMVETKRPSPNAQFASVHRDSISVEP
jgi:hypothetical protein